MKMIRIKAQPRNRAKERQMLRAGKKLVGQRVVVVTKDWLINGPLTEVGADFFKLDELPRRQSRHRIWDGGTVVSPLFINIQSVLEISREGEWAPGWWPQ